MKKFYIIILVFVSSHLYGIETNLMTQYQFQSVNYNLFQTDYNPYIIEIKNNLVNETYYLPRRVKPIDPPDPYLNPIGDIPGAFIILLISLYILRMKMK